MASDTLETAQTIDLDPRKAIVRIDGWLDGLIGLLPNIIVALIFAALMWYVARGVGFGIRRTLAARKRDNLGDILASFARWSVFIFGVMIALTIVLPNLNPGDLVAGLGIGTVAIGFAFKDILQNWLAGLLLLLRQPFGVGDEIEVGSHSGTVERIESRATLIRTYDGQRVIIPNAELYTDVVQVITAYPTRRLQMDFGIGYDDDIDTACQVMLDAVAGIEGLEADPAPQALPWSLDASWVTIRLRWWVKSDGPIIGTRVEVLKSVKRALDDAGIDIPFNVQTHLFRDETPPELAQKRAEAVANLARAPRES
ncbi:mechanosensitive ion channel family protein [Pseudorhodobacter aquimaris]|uniref:mechanosensitive ion channel family protein n=1 Tax=Pseudorhodobacter aquimaris TaxID=687412 RepID=UPI00067D2A08|nr:mechanosensitive ion channel family protein [Pseudorhodobacter aquimaris]